MHEDHKHDIVQMDYLNKANKYMHSFCVDEISRTLTDYSALVCFLGGADGPEAGTTVSLQGYICILTDGSLDERSLTIITVYTASSTLPLFNSSYKSTKNVCKSHDFKILVD